MKSKLYFRIIILALFISVYEKSNAQSISPSWIWAKSINGTNQGLAENPSIAVSPSGSGDVYTTNAFRGTVDFDPGPDSFNLTSTALYDDMFISKLNSAGNFVWAKQMAGWSIGGSSYGNSIAIDPSESGDVYTTGAFYGTVDFDPGPGTFNILYTGTEYNNADIFVSKLDSSGHFKWAKRMGGNGDAFGRSIIVDPSGSGDVYTLGSFKGKVDFNPGADSFFLTSMGEYDIFISKLDSLGNFLWAKRIGGSGNDIGFSITFDSSGSGNVYVTGDFTGRVDFDPGVNIYNLNSVGVFDIFILKLDSAGHFKWAQPMWGTNSKGGAGYSIAIDPSGSGDVYTTGYFEGEVDFDPGKGIFNLQSQYQNDIFISKLDSLGNFRWAKRIGGPADDKGISIVFDPIGDESVYIMGNFAETVDFNPDVADTFNLTSAEGHDYFITKFDSEGNFEWAKQVIGIQPDQGASIAFDGRSLYVAGLFLSPTISFDSISVTNAFNSNPNVFIAKLDVLTTSVVNIDSKKQQINIYPNPAKDELTIGIDGDELFNVDISLFNILGEVVYLKPNERISHQTTIDISSLSTGIYFIELNIDGNKVVEKVVKE